MTPNEFSPLEFSTLEQQLRAMMPARLTPNLEQRCFHALMQTLEPCSLVDQRAAQHMSQISPETISLSLLEKLEACVAKTPFPIDENVLLFTGKNAQMPAAKSSRWKFSRAQLSASAAVILFGGLSAWLIPMQGANPQSAPSIAKIDTIAAPVKASTGALGATNPSIPNVSTSNIVPAANHHNIQDASDEGIVWQGNKARRVLRVVYTEKAHYTNSKGEKVEYDRPRVEYILAPENIN